MIDENRRIINNHRTLIGQSKLSYTHIIGWAIVKALKLNPSLNCAYTEQNGEPFRIVRHQINFGLAIDLPGRDGGRSLVVPSIKNVGEMTISQFLKGYDELVGKGRKGKLALPDFQGTTISLTNPGTMGTVGSIPRLMPGQGCIIATGAIDYPAEYQGASDEVRAMLGLGKVMNITCTYDHRIIQGAESGMFLAKIAGLLQGEDGFYDEMFADLRLPHPPREVGDRSQHLWRARGRCFWWQRTGQRGRGVATDQRLSHARPLDCRPRPAWLGTVLSS